jgi:hypothetical protein
MSVHHFRSFQDPHELARHPQLEPEVKRAILASWASDACAVRSQPGLRKPPDVPQPIPVRDVLDALKSLDSTE